MNDSGKKKALIAMSGGVDSSVAALLTKEMGYDCVGCTMRLFDKNDGSDDISDARAVADRLSMPFYPLDYRERFRECVIDRFVGAYREGRTPNPCIDCNRYMKFGALWDAAEEMGCDVIVTGHYARVVEDGGRYFLERAVDRAKDQSYVLYSLTEKQLSHTLFPLGTLCKDEIRRIAAEHGFVNAAKKDSQDICFVPDGKYAAALERFCGSVDECGDFVDVEGKILGRHKGISHYTIGQHKGLGIVTTRPLYVKSILPADRKIVLCENDELFEREFYVRDLSFIAGEPPCEHFRADVKIRYRHKESPAEIFVSGSRAKVVFDSPERAITPGQSAVFYDGDRVLGGGKIE